MTIPSEVARGVVARSVAALSKGPFDGAQGRPNRLLGYVENMSGYYCRDCNAIKPLFDSPSGSSDPSTSLGSGLGIPCLGTVPFDPDLARHCDLGIPLEASRETPVVLALDQIAQRLMDVLDKEGPMKFLCVPCDSPMKLQTVGPPDRGSLSVVYSCPECGYEMAMLTNPYETQVVQSLGVRIGPAEGSAEAAGATSKCPFPAMMPAMEGPLDGAQGGPVRVDVRSRSAAREHSRVRPPHGADRHREIRPGERGPGSG